jgi:hypothetical protein
VEDAGVKLLAHGFLAFAVLVSALLSFEIKPAPRIVEFAVVVAALLLARAAPSFGRVLQGLVVALLAIQACVAAFTQMMLVAAPAASDGHAVMPIGQVLLGSVVGIAAGVALAVTYLRRWRRADLEVYYLASFAVVLAIGTAWDGIRGA